MGNVKLHPSKLMGEVKVPPSKSIAHRAVICSALSNTNKFLGLNLSDDLIATSKGMQTLREGGEVVIDCNESGSTLRFLIPISLVLGNGGRFLGRGNLGKRPLTPFYPIFDQCKIQYEECSNVSLDFRINGKLVSGNYSISGDISSQFISGLFFALPLLSGDSTLTITTPLESKGYLDLTRSVMDEFGVKVEKKENQVYYIKGNQSYQNQNFEIEGDYSQAAFFLCANTLGSNIRIANLKRDSLQGDKAALELLSKIKEQNTSSLITIDGSQCPDIIPVIALAAALQEGKKTQIIHAQRLRLKECDRISAVTQELNKLGANIKELADGFYIEGVAQLRGGTEVWSHKDHRIAMMLSIAATVCKNPIILQDYECVSKSSPDFFKDYLQLGGIASEWSMG
ncbi:MAG: 3-phosphoshikimate 1-carboxyvinyltransferase [Anaerovorax sp.]|nr:3-phosphoshikimate 1-carboxyvinyltransferase [Anaerovorax sp.]